MIKKQDQVIVNNFLKELTKEIVKKYKKDIDFIILYGSAARNEFIIGASDVDLVIQTKNTQSIEPIKKYSTKLFWKLDKKHKTQFHKVCAAKKPKTLLGKIIKECEKHTGIYVPLFVFAPGDIDWVNGKYLKKGYKTGANLFGPTAAVFNRFKVEGKILHGRDIRKLINPKITLWERYKGIMVPVWLTLGASFLVLLNPKKAVKNCTKALFYEVDAALFYVDKLEGDTKARKQKIKKLPEFNIEIKSLNSLIELNLNAKYKAINPKDFDIIEQALHIKINGFEGTNKEARKFVWKTWRFVNTLNFVVMFRKLFSWY